MNKKYCSIPTEEITALIPLPKVLDTSTKLVCQLRVRRRPVLPRSICHVARPLDRGDSVGGSRTRQCGHAKHLTSLYREASTQEEGNDYAF